MGRCKHDRHVSIIEEYRTETIHDVEVGGTVLSHVSDGQNGDYTGRVEVKCSDCGAYYKFNRFVTHKGFYRIPEWVRDSLEAAGCPAIIMRGRWRRRMTTGPRARKE